MINNLEGKNKAELIEIIKIQIEEYQKLVSENAKRDIEQQAKGAKIGFIAGACYPHNDFHYEAELFSEQLRNQAKGEL